MAPIVTILASLVGPLVSLAKRVIGRSARNREPDIQITWDTLDKATIVEMANGKPRKMPRGAIKAMHWPTTGYGLTRFEAALELMEKLRRGAP